MGHYPPSAFANPESFVWWRQLCDLLAVFYVVHVRFVEAVLFQNGLLVE
jgi:hypothetical protein